MMRFVVIYVIKMILFADTMQLQELIVRNLKTKFEFQICCNLFMNEEIIRVEET